MFFHSTRTGDILDVQLLWTLIRDRAPCRARRSVQRFRLYTSQLQSTGHATDGAAIERALDGVDAAYYLVHSLGSADFEERDRSAAATVAKAAASCGVRQLLYLAGWAIPRLISHVICAAARRRHESSPPAPSP